MGGSEVDFVKTQFGSGFKIDNPNFKVGGCGCGSGACATGSGEGCGSGACGCS